MLIWDEAPIRGNTVNKQLLARSPSRCEYTNIYLEKSQTHIPTNLC